MGRRKLILMPFATGHSSCEAPFRIYVVGTTTYTHQEIRRLTELISKREILCEYCTSIFLMSQTDVQVSILRSDFLKCRARILFHLYPDQVSSIHNYAFEVLGFFFPFSFFCWSCKILWHLNINLGSTVTPPKCWLHSVCTLYQQSCTQVEARTDLSLHAVQLHMLLCFSALGISALPI